MSTSTNTSRPHTPTPSARPLPSSKPMRTTRSAAKKLAQPPRASSNASSVPAETEPREVVATSATASRSASQAQSRPHHDPGPDVDVVYDSTGEQELAPADPAQAAVHLAVPLDPIQSALPARPFSPVATDPVTPTRTHLPAIPPPQALTHPLPKRPDAATVDTALRASPPPKKRKSPPTPDSDSDEDGQLLSEYMCPICFSPPKAAVITPCGHILCGACLHGATTARAPGALPLCPICRTPIPGLRFVISQPHEGQGGRPNPTGTGDRMGPMGDLLARLPGRDRPPRRRYVPPPSRIIPGGLVLPTHGEDMVDVVDGGDVDEIVDVDAEESEEEREREWKEDPSRSGVVGLEVLTMGRL